MKSDPQIARLVRELRGKKSQQEFARYLGVKRNTVTAWENCKNPVSRDVLLRLSNLADVPLRRRLWQLAGLDEEKVWDAAVNVRSDLLKDSVAADLKGKVVFVQPLDRGAGTRTEAIPVPIEFVRDPLSACFLEIDKKSAGFAFQVGDVAILERNSGDSQKPGPFFDQIVLVQSLSGSQSLLNLAPKNVLLIGRLRLRSFPSPTELARAREEGRTRRDYVNGFSADLDLLNVWAADPTHIGFYAPGKDPIKEQMDDLAEEKLDRFSGLAVETLAREKMKLGEEISILARVIAWFPCGKRLLEEK